MLGEEEGEEEIEKDEGKGMEMNIPLEDFGVVFFREKPTFDRLILLIKRIEKGSKVKVWREGMKYFPTTSTGQELGMAYETVGFSFIPVEVVDKPLQKEIPPPLKEEKLLPNWANDPAQARMIRDLYRNVAPQAELAQLNQQLNQLNNARPSRGIGMPRVVDNLFAPRRAR